MNPTEDISFPRRVALIHAVRGPVTRELWSGTPHGLIGGMQELGIDVVELGYEAALPTRASVVIANRLSGRWADRADHSPVKMRARQAAHQRAAARARGVDAGIAVGTDLYGLDRVRWGFPVATYDDTTFQTMWNHGDSDVRIRGFAERDVRTWIDTQRSSMRFADVNCVSTAWAARSVAIDYEIPTNRVRVVGMGHLPRRERRPETREWGSPVFLFLGVEWQRKNGGRVLEAFREVRKRFPDAELHLVGEHPKVDEPGVIDHGYLPRSDAVAQAELDAVFRRATALVLPSLFDPSPISYLEAASAGVPVVATTEGGAGELLGEAAIPVHPRDTAQIADAMLQLCVPAEAERRGRASIAIAEASTWRNVAERVIRALSEAHG